MAKTPKKTSVAMSEEDISHQLCEAGSPEIPAPRARPSMAGFAAASSKRPPWRMAKALDTLLSQINVLVPGRSKISDGGVGDDRHWKLREKSDHNPWIMVGSNGVVTARDFTHDKKKGCDAQKLADSLVAAKDARVKYIIWNSQICNSSKTGGTAAWAWRLYTGKNKHDKHIHISVKSTKSHYDDTSLWTISVK